MDKKEDDVGEVRKQEEGDLIEKRMKEKKRSQIEKEGASSRGSQGDRSGRTKKGRKETKEEKEGDPIKVDSDSDTAERETYHKAEITKKDLKEKERSRD